jgi:hypothetical protein
MRTRQPAVAGKFYPDDKQELSDQLSFILEKETSEINRDLARKEILGAIVPHAGYMFSAYQAIHFFEILRLSGQMFDTFFIINPNHTGFGPEIALEENDYWKTPFGLVEIDKLFHGFLDYNESEDAHKFEHSGEVILPMLQYCLDYSFKIVPITMFRQSPQNARSLAAAIVEANKHLHKKICIIASSDFSHFVSPERGKKLDQLVLDEIQGFNTEAVFQTVRKNHISVCGYGPIMTLMEYSRLVRSDPKNEILRRGHSGEVHPSNEVVDYVSMLFYQDPE